MKPSNPNPIKPSSFAEHILGVRLWSIQRNILDAIQTQRRVCVAGCHASGKTYAAALAALWFATRYANSRVLIIAPGWLTVRSVLWHEIHELLSRARLRLPLDTHNQTEIKLASSLILGLSTNDGGRLAGHHAQHVLLIIDEAPAVDPTFWPYLDGIAAGGDSRVLMLGNPTITSGYFYDAFTRSRSSWQCFSISAFDSPNLAGLTLSDLLALPDQALDDNVMPFLTTRRWVRERYAEWWSGSPENSPLWQSRVLGEFPSSASNALIPLQWLENARQPARDAAGASIIVGVDPAGSGRDLTAAVAVCGGAIVDSQTWADADSRGVVLQWLKKYQDRIRLIRVDSAGLGFYFAECIRDAGYRTIGVNVASKPRDPDKFVNDKAERFWNLRLKFEAGEISGLTDEMLSELAPITWLVNARGLIEIESKASVKAALGHSPDLGEALMLSLGEGPPAPYEYRPAPLPRGFFDSILVADDAANPDSPHANARAIAAAEDNQGLMLSHRMNRWGKWRYY